MLSSLCLAESLQNKSNAKNNFYCGDSLENGEIKDISHIALLQS